MPHFWLPVSSLVSHHIVGAGKKVCTSTYLSIYLSVTCDLIFDECEVLCSRREVCFCLSEVLGAGTVKFRRHFSFVLEVSCIF